VCLLEGCDLGRYASALRGQGVTGADLAIAADDDLRELGVGLMLHRKRLLAQVDEFAATGVPLSLLRTTAGGGSGGIGGSGGSGGGSGIGGVDGIGGMRGIGGHGIGGHGVAGVRAAARPSASAEDESSLCVICLDQPRCFVLVPCGHLCICGACTSKLGGESLCPICRGPVEAVHKVYT